MLVASNLSTTPNTLMALLPCANAGPASNASMDPRMRAFRMGGVPSRFKGALTRLNPFYHRSGGAAQGRAVKPCWRELFIAFLSLFPSQRCGSMIVTRLCFAVAAFVLAGGSAFAGVIVTSSHTDIASKQTNQAMAYVEGDRMKVVTPDTIVIFRGDQNRTWV